MKGRPDVIKELNLDDGLQSTRRETNCAADDIRFRERRVVYARAAKLALQVRGDFKDAALALYLIQRFFARAIGNVFAENQDARIAFHFRVQAAVDEIDHRACFVAQRYLVFGIKLFGSWIDRRRINKVGGGFRRWL